MTIEPKNKSLIDELDRFLPGKSRHSVVESRAAHIIASAVNLVHLIRESYPQEQADDLVKRLYRSIITEDSEKFRRKIRTIKESDNESK